MCFRNNTMNFVFFSAHAWSAEQLYFLENFQHTMCNVLWVATLSHALNGWVKTCTERSIHHNIVCFDLQMTTIGKHLMKNFPYETKPVLLKSIYIRFPYIRIKYRTTREKKTHTHATVEGRTRKVYEINKNYNCFC